MDNIKINFNLNEGLLICTGVSFLYNCVGSGPYDVDIRFQGESSWVANKDSWREFSCCNTADKQRT